MIQLRLFRNRWFSISLFCAFVSYVCIGASTILLPFYLEDTQKYTAAGAGLFLMFSPLIVTVVSPIAGLLTDRIGPKIPSMFGLACMAVGFWLLAGLQVRSVFGAVALSMGVMSLGQGLFQPPNNTLVMSAASRDMLGAVGSINAFIRNLGQIIGVTVSTTFLYLFMSWKTGMRVTDYPKGQDAVFLFGMHGVYFILVVICVAGVVMTVTRFLHRTPSQTE